jgi:Protein of unknown function (DUF2946)
MLSQRLFKLINKIALFAIVFASLAPSVSHALAAQQRTSTFAQEVCTADGSKVTIQVVTTKGKQIATELPAQTSEKVPTGIQHHMQHCPFCANPSTDAALQAPHTPIIAFLTVQTEKQAAIKPVVFSSFSPLPPPAQAPPNFN